MNFAIVLLVGAVGGHLFRRWKVPGGMLVGALIATALWNIAFETAVVPHWARTAAQIIAGAFSGSIITRSDVKRIPRVIGPILWVLGSFFLINIGIGTLLSAVSSMDLITCYLAMIPGSAMNTPIIAADYGADVTAVAVLQIVRLLIGIGVFPSMIIWYDKRRRQTGTSTPSGGQAATTHSSPKASSSFRMNDFLLTLAVAALTGWLGAISPVPSGAMIFAVIGVICLNLSCGRVCLTGWLKKIAQIICGCYIGAHIGRSDLIQLVFLALPAFIIVCVYSFNCFFMGHLLMRRFGYVTRKAMLMVTPAGASDMLLISSDVGVEDSDLVIVHMIRMVSAVLIFPPLVGWIANLLS